jgi:excisionase family DNA binding protein
MLSIQAATDKARERRKRFLCSLAFFQTKGSDAQAQHSTAERGDSVRKKLYTIEEMAWAMSLGRNKAYELVLRGEIASVKIGTLRRVSVEALDAFIRQREGVR